jgi:hypothetical protein
VLVEELETETLGKVDLREEKRVVVHFLVLRDVGGSRTLRDLASDEVPAEFAEL